MNTLSFWTVILISYLCIGIICTGYWWDEISKLEGEEKNSLAAVVPFIWPIILLFQIGESIKIAKKKK